MMQMVIDNFFLLGVGGMLAVKRDEGGRAVAVWRAYERCISGQGW